MVECLAVRVTLLVSAPSTLCMVLARDSDGCRESEGIRDAGFNQEGIG